MNPYASIEDILRFGDSRTLLQLSGDQNLSQGQRSNIQFGLDLAAGELESLICTRTSLPIAAQAVPAQGTVALTGIPADNSTLTLSDGITTIPFTYLSGGTGMTQIDTASANEGTITGIAGTKVRNSGLALSTTESGVVLTLTNVANGTIGNVAITTTSPLVMVSGMAGGATQMPQILTLWVLSKAVESMFGRRSSLPENWRMRIAWADRWAQMYMKRLVSIPGAGWSAEPALYPNAQTANNDLGFANAFGCGCNGNVW